MAQKRLDILLCERGLCKSREEAQAHILAGAVWSGERRLDKAGTKYPEDIPLDLQSRALPFVSRAGLKLAHALQVFGLDVNDKVCLDIGASTGGFTDCLLQNGARHVFAVDVGYGQLDAKLRNDPRVTCRERINARYLRREELGRGELENEISFIVMDVSFISLNKILESIRPEFENVKDWVLLFKPQFEVGPAHIGKGGLVRSQKAVEDSLAAFEEFMRQGGFIRRHGPEASPVAGKKSGNQEYLIHYELTSNG